MTFDRAHYRARMPSSSSPFVGDSPLVRRLNAALEYAHVVGEYGLVEFNANFRGGLGAGVGSGEGIAHVETKRDGSVVTRVDRECERRIRELIQRDFAGDAILGEELGEHTPNSWRASDVEGGTQSSALSSTHSDHGWRWILDPIDGTRSFVHGVPFWGVMIALEHTSAGEGTAGAGKSTTNSTPVARYTGGVIAFPALGEVMAAGRGLGSWWLNADRPWVRSRVSTQRELAQSTMIMTSPKSLIELMGAEKFGALCMSAHVTRGWSDCYGHTLVATGRADVMLDPPMAVWDIAPMVPIIEEAGGHITDFEGGAAVPGKGVLTCNAGLFEEMKRRLG